jgi:hypothetical protein
MVFAVIAVLVLLLMALFGRAGWWRAEPAPGVGGYNSNGQAQVSTEG